MYVNFASVSGAGVPYIAKDDTLEHSSLIAFSKPTADKVLWCMHRAPWVNNHNWVVTGVNDGCVIQMPTASRVLSVFDATSQSTITARESDSSSASTEYFAVGIPSAE